MKELQAGIQRIQAKCIPLSRKPVSQKKRRGLERQLPPIRVTTLPENLSESQKPLLSFPVKSSLGVLRQRMTKGIRRLESQAEYINRLSVELEAAVMELKAIASDLNRDWRAIQATQNSTSTDVCEYRAAVVPKVEMKSDGSFILSSRTVDLFQAEREAAILAQTLRHRAKKKQGHRNGR